ncbi:MAG: hypothetical protein EOP07_19545 [Proteobacteria bacterium]|nr:MAG: hypothetical protein EOP07_19545 [Pseudomonadota bacterium]
MKIFPFIFAVCAFNQSSIQAAELEIAQPPRVTLPLDISNLLTSEMKDNVLKSKSSDSWRFSSLSCIAADFADGGSGEPFFQKECTFEDSQSVEFKISADLSALLIEALVAAQISPLGGSSEELQFYSVKDFVCEIPSSSQCDAKQREESAAAQCHFQNTPALFSEN